MIFTFWGDLDLLYVKRYEFHVISQYFAQWLQPRLYDRLSHYPQAFLSRNTLKLSYLETQKDLSSFKT